MEGIEMAQHSGPKVPQPKQDTSDNNSEGVLDFNAHFKSRGESLRVKSPPVPGNGKNKFSISGEGLLDVNEEEGDKSDVNS